MEFRITTHTCYGAPLDAIEALWPHLQDERGERASFVRGHKEIRAILGLDDSNQAVREERMERERRAVLEVVCEVCSRAPGLESDWYAVSPAG
jgi:hypothetical protein